MQKTCSSCGNKMTISKFHKDIATKDGLQNNCKVCQKGYSSSYYVSNREYCNEYAKLFYHFKKKNLTEIQYDKQREILRKKYQVKGRKGV